MNLSRPRTSSESFGHGGEGPLLAKARQQINQLAAWWDEHRRDARVRVEDALDAALAVLAEHRTLAGLTRRIRGTGRGGSRAPLTCCSTGSMSQPTRYGQELWIAV